jgi:hypothetical protein
MYEEKHCQNDDSRAAGHVLRGQVVFSGPLHSVNRQSFVIHHEHSFVQKEMEQEMDQKIEECNTARNVLRGRKKNAMAKKNKVAQAVNAKQQQINIAQQNVAEAEQQIDDVRARGDDQESIDKKMAEWHAAHTHTMEVVQASQQALHDYRKESESIDVRFSTLLMPQMHFPRMRCSIDVLCWWATVCSCKVVHNEQVITASLVVTLHTVCSFCLLWSFTILFQTRCQQCTCK